ncbi:bZIP transcription factor [Halorubrum sp. GN11_10-6_MGM]|uniref:DUF7518 family protein n=1 Tax=Halorubrum sp. GN11_10-6_MGM TaxID=2518112 RepID=UPI0010F8D04F|nr:bZIP transcription factor [Halorubrum sp. GN11_10-6_MGM]TKX75723.1 bZIP transcription factor [Halorubrum sp. GN11_10-6_MGM]
MSNRVEDLERQVAELQAAVNGLTEELVEMKERVRQLEDERSVAVETEATTGSEGDAADATADGSSGDDPAERASGGERTTHSDDHVDVIEPTDDPATDTDGVVVPGQSATTDAEAGDDAETDSDAANGEDDGESSEGDDIIVA